MLNECIEFLILFTSQLFCSKYVWYGIHSEIISGCDEGCKNPNKGYFTFEVYLTIRAKTLNKHSFQNIYTFQNCGLGEREREKERK